eukprot:TRINITY_DN1779_c0_g1_i2.p1 TRINITY_DN1779_c0_g1~~TRINITY_DN1779_c0_g1_i2.p1  ORF type:complete len:163 (+),score=28.29 TRINITY_DN1779_c0_g1_i2:364-852(+)
MIYLNMINHNLIIFIIETNAYNFSVNLKNRSIFSFIPTSITKFRNQLSSILKIALFLAISNSKLVGDSWIQGATLIMEGSNCLYYHLDENPVDFASLDVLSLIQEDNTSIKNKKNKIDLNYNSAVDQFLSHSKIKRSLQLIERIFFYSFVLLLIFLFYLFFL